MALDTENINQNSENDDNEEDKDNQNQLEIDVSVAGEETAVGLRTEIADTLKVDAGLADAVMADTLGTGGGGIEDFGADSLSAVIETLAAGDAEIGLTITGNNEDALGSMFSDKRPGTAGAGEDDGADSLFGSIFSNEGEDGPGRGDVGGNAGDGDSDPGSGNGFGDPRVMAGDEAFEQDDQSGTSGSQTPQDSGDDGAEREGSVTNGETTIIRIGTVENGETTIEYLDEDGNGENSGDAGGPSGEPGGESGAAGAPNGGSDGESGGAGEPSGGSGGGEGASGGSGSESGGDPDTSGGSGGTEETSTTPAGGGTTQPGAGGGSGGDGDNDDDGNAVLDLLSDLPGNGNDGTTQPGTTQPGSQGDHASDDDVEFDFGGPNDGTTQPGTTQPDPSQPDGAGGSPSHIDVDNGGAIDPMGPTTQLGLTSFQTDGGVRAELSGEIGLMGSGPDESASGISDGLL